MGVSGSGRHEPGRALASENEAHEAQRAELHRVEHGAAPRDPQAAALRAQHVPVAAYVLAHALVAPEPVHDEIRLDAELPAVPAYDAHVADHAPRARAGKFGVRVLVLEARDAAADAVDVVG